MLGSGTLADPYIIQNVNDLQNVRLLDAAYYELGNDIDASITSTWFGGRGFEPLDWPFPQKRRPAGDFSSTGVWTVQPAAPPTKFDKVNEIDHDGDSTYIRVASGGGTILFTSPNFDIPAGSTDIQIIPMLVFRSESGSGSLCFYGYVRVNGVNYQSPYYIIWPSTPPTTYTWKGAREFINNPATGLPWTVDDINGVGPNPLQAWGVKITGTVACRITQIYARVRCTPGIVFSFDGKGHTISNLYIDRSVGSDIRRNDIGLFGESYGGDIKNINLVGVNLKAYISLGGIAGGMYAAGGGISNCSVSGTLQTTSISWGIVGGITSFVGYAGHNIINCHFSGTITTVSEGGGIVGEAYNPTALPLTISNCSFNGQIVATGSYIGGIVGLSSGFDFSSCSSQGSITGAHVGGIVGELGDGNVVDCHSSANITGTSNYVGGLFGSAYLSALPPLSCSISKCSASGNVSAVGCDEVGGLVGSTWEYKIEQSFATGDVTGRQDVGGLVGVNGSFNLNCYASGAVDGDWLVGGLVGYHRDYSVEKCYSKGLVLPGISEIGGFIGWNDAIITDSFWDKDTSGMTIGVGHGSSAGVEGKTTEEMNHLPIFTAAGWDFASVWNISRVTTGLSTNITPGSAMLGGLLNLTIINEAYPFLRWQSVVELPCDCGFEWGETEAFGNFTPIDSKNTGEAFAKALAGLEPNTAYYFRARASSSPGPIHGGTGTFITLVGIEVETLPATNITENSARIWGRVRKVPVTAMARFDWGGNIEYGAQTPWAPRLVSDDMFYHDLRNLAEGRAYHFRAVAMGSALVYGNDMVFTTLSPLGPVTLIQEELAHLMEVS